MHGECACHPGFAGLECQYDARCPNFCSMHGSCEAGFEAESADGEEGVPLPRCVCSGGWRGIDCSTPPRQTTVEDEADDFETPPPAVPGSTPKAVDLRVAQPEGPRTEQGRSTTSKTRRRLRLLRHALVPRGPPM